jgi:beta-galactosidase
VQSPLGFRFFSLPKRGAFTLNGKPLLLRGVNRHQDRDGVGYAMSDEDHRRDVELVKELGFNFLRHAHYPPDPALMRAADELGVLVWMEIPVTVSVSTSPEFLANAKTQLTEMIRQNYNHPSVIVWGLGNEADQAVGNGHPQLTEAYTNRFFRELNDLAHQLDRTRPTTGCNFKLASNQAIVDAYSPQAWNGWYVGDAYVGRYTPTQLIGEFGADADLNVHREPGAQKKFDWSQEYQARFHEYYVAEGEGRKDQFPGYASFVLADFASPRKDRTSPNTIQFMNQKGLLLYDHKTPKDVYHFYKSMLTDGRKKPMVYIVSHTWLDRWTAPAAKTIWAYSNCDEVRLYNGMGTEPLGARKKTDGEHPTVKTRFQWTGAMVRYNVLYAEGIIDGKVVATDKIVLKNLPAPP